MTARIFPRRFALLLLLATAGISPFSPECRRANRCASSAPPGTGNSKVAAVALERQPDRNANRCSCHRRQDLFFIVKIIGQLVAAGRSGGSLRNHRQRYGQFLGANLYDEREQSHVDWLEIRHAVYRSLESLPRWKTVRNSFRLATWRSARLRTNTGRCRAQAILTRRLRASLATAMSGPT